MPVSPFFLFIFVGRFPHYSREHLVNHAPRYAIVTSCVVFVRKGYCAGRNSNKPNLETSAFMHVIGEFKKLRRQLQRKRHIKIELCVKLSLLRKFHVNHFVQNRRTALSLAWYERFSCKGKEGKIYCCELALSSQPKI